MTRRLPRWRLLVAVVVVVVAWPVGVAAAAPGVNSADLLAVVLPFIFIAAVWPLITQESSS